MSEIVRLFFNHSQHKLEVEGLHVILDVLAFEGEGRLSQAFKYGIEFTSPIQGIVAEHILNRDATFSSNAPPQKAPPRGFQATVIKPLPWLDADNGGRLGLLRYYNLRLFPLRYSHVLQPEQELPWLRPAELGSWLDGDGTARHLPGMAQAPDSEAAYEPITLSDQQVETLSCASDANQFSDEQRTVFSGDWEAERHFQFCTRRDSGGFASGKRALSLCAQATARAWQRHLENRGNRAMNAKLGRRYGIGVMVMLVAQGCLASTIEAVNHTHWAINRFSVDGRSGIDIIGAYQGGGGGCCFVVPETWIPGMTVQVNWETGVGSTKDFPGFGDEEKYLLWRDTLRKQKRQHSKAVSVPDYTGQKVCGITVHFLPCDDVQVTTSCYAYGSPEYPIKTPLHLPEPQSCPK